MEPKLVKLRDKIDTIDARIMKSLAQRQALSRTIGDLKAIKGLKILDYKRYQEMLEQRLSMADELDLPRALVKKIFTLIHTSSVEEQKKEI